MMQIRIKLAYWLETAATALMLASVCVYPLTLRTSLPTPKPIVDDRPPAYPGAIEDTLRAVEYWGEELTG